MIKDYLIQNDKLKLILDNKKHCICILPALIEKIMIVSNNAIVVTHTNAKVKNRNIFKVSEAGVIQWQVEDAFKSRGVKTDASAAFTALSIQDEKIFGYALDSFTYEIDFETGKLKNPVLTK